MSCRPPLLPGVIAMSVILLASAVSAAAQSMAPTPDQTPSVLAPMSKTPASKTPASKPPVAKPVAPAARRPAVKTPPVVEPPRNVHAKKPLTTPPAKAQPKPAPVHPGVVAPVPVPVPVPSPDASATEPNKGSVTGLPLPRWVSLRANEVNLRSGPGTRYPVEWQYRRQDLPVEIEREFDVWRLIEDQDGVKGWVNQATLVSRRSFVVTGSERTLRSAADDKAAPVALLKPGVIGRIRSCAAGNDWCEMQVGDYRGWLRRSEVFGTYPGEVVGG